MPLFIVTIHRQKDTNYGARTGVKVLGFISSCMKHCKLTNKHGTKHWRIARDGGDAARDVFQVCPVAGCGGNGGLDARDSLWEYWARELSSRRSHASLS